MNKKLFYLICCFSVYTGLLTAQPFVDLVNFNSQHFLSRYDSSQNKVYIQDNFLNFFAPVKFKKNNLILIRLNTERLSLTRYDSVRTTKNLYSLSLPLGFVLVTKSELWKFTGLVIPKINTDFKDNLDHDFQLGTILLVTRVVSKNLSVRLGLYYNKEFFGNFWLPLAGVDWKINDRFQMYGTMPSNFRFEYKLSRHWNTGLNFRAFLRSYRLNATEANDYIWARENQLKLYMERFIYKNLLFSFDVFRVLTYSLSKYDSRIQKQKTSDTPAYSPFGKNFGISISFAYRIMTNKPEPKQDQEK